MLNKTLLTTIVLFLAASTYADVARPDSSRAGKNAKAIDTYLSIQLDRGADQARLIIPRSQLKALRAELERFDDDSETLAAASSISRLQTMVGGAFLSLAIIFAGIWFTRRQNPPSRPGRAAAAAVGIFAFGALAAIVYGNAGPPAEARSITGKMFAPAMHVYKFGGGKIRLEVSDTETQPKLIVPDPESKPSE